MRSNRAVPLSALLACLACGGREPTETSEEKGAVLRGTPSGAEDDAVVVVVSDGPALDLTCTATLIAPNLLVTAQHCVSSFNDGPFSCTNEGELVPGSEYGQMGTLLPAEKISVFTGSAPNRQGTPHAVGERIFAPQATSICKNDIAFVLLDRDLPIAPAMVRFESGIVPGELARGVGYGQTETGGYGERRTRSDVRIALVGESSFRPEGDATPPFTFATQGPFLCTGDSGGPMFAETGAFLGVFSRFNGACTSSITRNYFTQAAPFARTIADEAFDAAGATPILEPPSASGGTAGVPPEEGGAAGEGGDGGGAAPAGTGGVSAGSGGAPPGGGGTAGAQAGGAGAPDRRGLRQRGGCRCDLPGSGRTTHESWLSVAAALAMSVVARQRRRQRR
jgi:hypothetical protein